MTRLWENQPITVEVDRTGSPIQFKWKGTVYSIAQVVDQWRADTDWWRGRIWREHFKVASKSGLLAVIYHDLLTDTWYIQQIYD